MSSQTTERNLLAVQRYRVFFWAVVAIAALYTARLAQLQIIQGARFRLKAEAQAIKQVKIEPFRGNIIDRNGRYIVQNAPGFSVTVVPYEFTPEACLLLADILGVDTADVMDDVRKAARYNKFAAAKIAVGKDIGYDAIGKIEELRDDLPGVDVVIDPKRLYSFDGNAAHLLGYTREVSEWHLKTLGNYYDPGDITGETGLEKAYETQIRGQKGYSYVAVNKNGQRVARFNDGKSDVPAREGFDLYLGLDVSLQELGEKLLDGRRGGIVGIDPRNGEILVFVSKPDFDLRNFTGRTSRAYYNQIYSNPEKPLINRASTPIYPPGSTWKMLMALAGLETGIITRTSTFVCTGAYHYGNRSCKCHGAHGAIAVENALRVSCNSYFNQLGLKLGIDRFHEYGTMFGFGQKTNADITEEERGILASRAYMDRRYGKNGWNQYRMVNLGIGQGEIGVTPLQMAVYTAALANGGVLHQPHAVREVYNNLTKRRERIQHYSRKLPISPEYFEIIRNGMKMVVESGTATGAKVPNVVVAGKTGTAENPHGKDHSWFVCFAPADSPTIALCVMVENAGFGSQAAAPIAQKLLNLKFNGVWPEDVHRDTSRVGAAPATKPTEERAPDPIGPFAVPSKPKPVARPSGPIAIKE
jgi:penicillin-binding protein 2